MGLFSWIKNLFKSNPDEARIYVDGQWVELGPRPDPIAISPELANGMPAEDEANAMRVNDDGSVVLVKAESEKGCATVGHTTPGWVDACVERYLKRMRRSSPYKNYSPETWDDFVRTEKPKMVKRAMKGEILF